MASCTDMGQREPQADVGRHHIVTYDESWPRRADALGDELRGALGDVAIEHIGSTSVPGLAGRPIIDVQVSVPDIRDRDSFAPQLARMGYQRLTVPELAGDDYFVFGPTDGSNDVHIHVCGAGSSEEESHLAVREFLRAHEDECRAYEAVKRRSADAADGIRERYVAGKRDFVRAMEARAVRWHRTSRGD